jgi:hypothetical protein
MKGAAMRRPMNRNFSRRRFLAGLGVSAAAAPFVPLLESAADGPEKPAKRFVVFFHPHGVIRDQWLPTGSTTDFTLPSILEPLGAVKDQLVVVDGLDIKYAGVLGAPHTVGPSWVFTASPMLEGNEFDHGCCPVHGWNSHPSIDQVIAGTIGEHTPYESIQLGVATGDKHPGSVISYKAAEDPLVPVSDPQQVFDWQFAGSEDDLAAAKRKAQRQSVIDAVKPELDALKGKVSKDDQIKIDRHLAALFDMEEQLQSTHTCAAPDIGPAVDIAVRANDGIVSTQQLDLMVALLACGRTNVASIMYRLAEADHATYPHLGLGHVQHHHNSHAPSGDPVWNDLNKIYTWYGSQVAYLATEMAKVIEPDGSTLLDNTIILWASELAEGNTHSMKNMPFVLVGGGGGSLQGNRFLQFSGENHCRLMVSLCNAYGLDVDSFGGFDDGSGALPGLFG